MELGNRKFAFKSLVGSHNYNLNIETSDKDYKVFVFPTFDDLYFNKSYSKSCIGETEDYDKLEKQLLGWTDDEEDCEQVENVKMENEIVEPVVETLDNSKIVEFMAKKIGSEVALKTWIIPNLTESKKRM